jgi:hypothetical protein
MVHSTHIIKENSITLVFLYTRCSPSPTSPPFCHSEERGLMIAAWILGHTVHPHFTTCYIFFKLSSVFAHTSK